MNLHKIKSKLEQIPIQELCFRTGFIKSHHYKISGFAYVLGFFHMTLQSGMNTLENWASKICKLTGFTVSAQALQEKLQFRHIEFSKQLLNDVLNQQVQTHPISKKYCQLIASFKRVFIEDSTCITLPKMLMDFFSGTVNQKGATSTARIQLRLELKSGNYTNIELQSYRDNDQKFASNILHKIKPGDLLLRDLGYYNLWVFRLVMEMEAFFLSRFRYSTLIFDKEKGHQIDLAKKLKSLKHRGIHVFDQEIRLGAKEQIPVRIIAIKAPPQVEQQRKRKMRKDRIEGHSQAYWELLGWTILITNVSKQLWPPQQVLQIYGYRWHIEIIFKCWKSKFNFTRFFKNKNSMGPPRAYITFYLLLVWLTLFFVRWFHFMLIHIYKSKGRILSMSKFVDYLKDNFDKIECIEDLVEETDFLSRYYTQTKRKEKSQLEFIYMLNSS